MLDGVAWNFAGAESNGGGAAAYTVELDYTAREDWTIDCSGGFEEINDQALTGTPLPEGASVAEAARGFAEARPALGGKVPYLRLVKSDT
mgnify:CR=1 FL=1